MTDDHEAAVAALADLMKALEGSMQLSARALGRAKWLHANAAKGRRFRHLLEEQDRPLIVEMVTANLRMLDAHGSRYRRAVARALYAEGMTTGEIADAFGVSRQRVSALLGNGHDHDPQEPHADK